MKIIAILAGLTSATALFGFASVQAGTIATPPAATPAAAAATSKTNAPTLAAAKKTPAVGPTATTTATTTAHLFGKLTPAKNTTPVTSAQVKQLPKGTGTWPIYSIIPAQGWVSPDISLTKMPSSQKVGTAELKYCRGLLPNLITVPNQAEAEKILLALTPAERSALDAGLKKGNLSIPSEFGPKQQCTAVQTYALINGHFPDKWIPIGPDTDIKGVVLGNPKPGTANPSLTLTAAEVFNPKLLQSGDANYALTYSNVQTSDAKAISQAQCAQLAKEMPNKIRLIWATNAALGASFIYSVETFGKDRCVAEGSSIQL